MSDRPEACEAAGCTSEPVYRVRFDEAGTEVTHKWLCVEHKNRERIHDPVNTAVVKSDWGPGYDG